MVAGSADVPTTAGSAWAREMANKAHDIDFANVATAEVDFANRFKDGDTLILITLSPGYNDAPSCQLMRFSEKQRLLFKSDLLRTCGLEKFAKLLDDARYQKRLEARLSRAGVTIPSTVKYLLDIGPSADEETRTQHLEALSLPKGIVQWSIAPDCRIGAPYDLAGGHDDQCGCSPYDKPELVLLADDTEKPKKAPPAATGLWDTPLEPAFRSVTDYCEVRHGANVVRMLRGIAGDTLLLDSAARVYTIAGLAMVFEIDQSSHFGDSLVCDWFMRPGNSKIVEILPEDVLRVCWNLKLPLVARSAYRILVAERALFEVGRPESRLARRPKETPFGRRTADVDEDVESILQHAGAAFADSMLQHKALLMSGAVFDILGISEWGKLNGLYRRLCAAQDGASTGLSWVARAFDSLKQALTEGMRDIVLAALLRLPDEMYRARTAADLAYYGTTAAADPSLWDSLTHDQRVLTSDFWDRLACLNETAFRHTVVRGIGAVFIADAVTEFNHAWVVNMQANRLVASAAVDRTAAQELANLVGPDEYAFDFRRFKDEVYLQLGQFCRRRHVQGACETDQDLDLPLSDYLVLNLDESHLKFLPLWAGGQNDGSGGVFAPEVPDALMGPNGPGPAYHTGHTQAETDEHQDEEHEWADMDSNVADAFEALSITSSHKTAVPHSVAAQDSASATTTVQSAQTEPFAPRDEDERDYIAAASADPATHSAAAASSASSATSGTAGTSEFSFV